MQRPMISHRSLPPLDQRRWFLILINMGTGAAFIIAALAISMQVQTLKSESAVRSERIAALGELRVISQRLKAVVSEYAHPDADDRYLENERYDQTRQINELIAQIRWDAQNSEGSSDVVPEITDSQLAQLEHNWKELNHQLQLLSLPHARPDRAAVLAQCDVLERDCVRLMQELNSAQTKNQSDRSWLLNMLVIGMALVGLLTIWLLWSATRNRLKVSALNTMLERRVAERTSQFERANLYLSKIQSSICSAMIVTNAQGRVISWNPAAEKMLGIVRGKAEGQDLHVLSPITYEDAFREALEQAKTYSQTVFLKEIRMDSGPGAPRYGNASIVPLLGDRAESQGIVLFIDDVTQMVEARHELARRAGEIADANQQLQSLNHDLEQFAYAASHDLRTPLVNLRGLSGKLERACDGVKQVVAAIPDRSNLELSDTRNLLEHDIPRLLSRMNSAIVKSGAMIDGLLRLSRIGRDDYPIAPLDMNRLVAKVVELHAIQIEQKDVHIFVNDLPNAWGDEDAITNVFSNLLGNALNYLDPSRSGEIMVDGEQLGQGSVRYYVRDNGVGIKEADLKKVFMVFKRLQPDRVEGEGLGLAIVRKIVERHGGQVGVESQWGEGTSFWFTLPVTDSERLARSEDEMVAA